ncbi:hypothetical protein CRUP_026569, partial [Coryphaenoides rupestris]
MRPRPLLPRSSQPEDTTTDSYSRNNCSFSRQRCWCTLEHNEQEKRSRHMAYMCVTSIAGNATSTMYSFTPLDI